MSREYYAAISNYHQDDQARWANPKACSECINDRHDACTGIICVEGNQATNTLCRCRQCYPQRPLGRTARRLGVRIADTMYVYVMEDGVHIRTLHVDISDYWDGDSLERLTDRKIARLAREAAGVSGQRVPVDLEQ